MLKFKKVFKSVQDGSFRSLSKTEVQNAIDRKTLSLEKEQGYLISDTFNTRRWLSGRSPKLLPADYESTPTKPSPWEARIELPKAQARRVHVATQLERLGIVVKAFSCEPATSPEA